MREVRGCGPFLREAVAWRDRLRGRETLRPRPADTLCPGGGPIR